jgi:cold shock CspA family protein
MSNTVDNTENSEFFDVNNSPLPVAENDYEEIVESSDHGSMIGNCKWFNKKLGYGFITVYTGDRRGVNIFVHHTGIKPLNSNFRTLRKGEYVHFNIVDGMNGLQATDVTGVLGGPLMCDNIETRRTSIGSRNNAGSHGGESVVHA